jgi:hypothetical protein
VVLPQATGAARPAGAGTQLAATGGSVPAGIGIVVLAAGIGLQTIRRRLGTALKAALAT